MPDLKPENVLLNLRMFQFERGYRLMDRRFWIVSTTLYFELLMMMHLNNFTEIQSFSKRFRRELSKKNNV